MNKIPETFTEEEFLKIVAEAKKKDHKAAYLFGFYQAMRISEIVNLRPENVDKGQKLIRIKEAKGKKDRNIPIAREVMGAVKQIPLKCGIRALQIAFKTHSKKALGRDLHFHNLRHSGATHYLNKGWNIRQVQQFLGHSKLETTQIYTVVKPEDLIAKMWE